MRQPWFHSAIALLALGGVGLATSVSEAKGERPLQVVRSDKSVIRGIVKAAAQAVLYAQVQGRISQVPFKEGQRFEKGKVLVQLDCEKYKAELAAAKAEHEAKDKTAQNNRSLMTLNAVSTLDLQISEAEEKKAAAAIKVAEVNVKGCHITAPFAGRVVGVMVNEYENVFPNDKLVSVLDDTSLEIELVVPSSALAWLRRKAPFTFMVDETQHGYPATIKEIGANVDPASQTIKIVGTFDRLPADILAGMSGSAQFAAGQPKGE
ncbi:MAG: efflux RND transporter periplasmic adaptor subunit [Nitrospira sp.]|uniref:HlyD_D23 domain-containing protein n=1 Tax=Nitrospira defluvii TaxID=330214 RepID=A0ABN7L588_9BACT|nr:efflux RND transporter periplasmic adaptor subunit [Nitrospira defluvii]MCS6329470.1 efflux RND transporter periplasmic adaptor subunit [Nitrospira sp.]CAE6728814.1 HlyD_D23 domain-containing protein [Nitrospira defluvii]